MTQPGWYPDQSGGPGQKYWDGYTWHDAIPPIPTPAGQPAPVRKPRSRNKKVLWGVIGGIGAIIVGSNLIEQISIKPDVRRSAPAPSISAPEVGAPGIQFPGLGGSSAPQSQDAPLGKALVLQLQQFQMDGSVTEATAAVNVGNLQQMPDGVLAPSGSYYAVGVTVAAVRGTVSVNPFFFAARTENGVNLTPTSVPIDNMLPATELPAGQKVAGFLGFDVPPGQLIKEIIYQEPTGAQLGRWLVP